MKKFILFILITIVVTTSYGFFNFDEKNDKKEVTSAFENYINAAQNEDVKTIHEYHIIWRNVWRTSQESYKYLTYKINDVKIINEKNENGKNLKFAYVNVSLKYPDLNYAMSYIESRKYGKNRILYNLFQKGIDRNISFYHLVL